MGGCKFRPQVPVDRYVADFACLEAKLIIELDGGQHAEQANYDAARTKVLEYAGFQVLRFWNPRVLQEIDGVLEEIIAALALARP